MSDTLCALHALQLTAWYRELQESLSSEQTSEAAEGAEEDLAQFEHQRDITIDASVNTISEGQNLVDHLRSVPCAEPLGLWAGLGSSLKLQVLGRYGSAKKNGGSFRTTSTILCPCANF